MVQRAGMMLRQFCLAQKSTLKQIWQYKFYPGLASVCSIDEAGGVDALPDTGLNPLCRADRNSGFLNTTQSYALIRSWTMRRVYV